MLPFEVESMLPTEPERLMESGFEVVRKAFVKNRDTLLAQVSQAKQEASSRVQEIDSLHLQIRELKAKNAELEEQARIMKEEKATLVRETLALKETVNMYQRQANKYAALRRSIISAVNNDDAIPASVLNISGIDIGREGSPVRSGMVGSASVSGTPYVPAVHAADPNLSASFAHMDMRSAASNSASPHEDGRAFFRDVKNSIPEEHFRRFIGSIRALNLNKCTKDDTMGVAHEIFGQQHRDLYHRFQRLIAATAPA